MDPVRFTGAEILEMALRIEENGFKFYTDACKTAKTTRLKELFRHLADEETNHVKSFSGLVKLSGDTSTSPIDINESDAPLYLRALADTEVFTSPNQGAKFGKNIENEKDALNFAIQMEKDSLLFYYELAGIIREKDRAILNSIIEQEKEHVLKLSTLKAELFK
jgi:rubrerythrin